MKELWYIGFYIWYFFEWLWLWYCYGDAHYAYKQISFEREAYKYESDFNYINNRKKFAQWE